MTRRRTPHSEILTPREWQVLSLLSEGLTNNQIAERLGVSERNAEDEVADIFSKLEVGAGTAAARPSRSLQSEQQPLLVGTLSSLFKKTFPALLKVGGITAGIIVVMAIADLVVGFC